MRFLDDRLGRCVRDMCDMFVFGTNCWVSLIGHPFHVRPLARYDTAVSRGKCNTTRA